jgi:hypothetical protein
MVHRSAALDLVGDQRIPLIEERMWNCSRALCAMATWQYSITDDQEPSTCLPLSSLFKARWATVALVSGRMVV